MTTHRLGDNAAFVAGRLTVLDLAVIILGLACGIALLQGIVGGEA